MATAAIGATDHRRVQVRLNEDDGGSSVSVVARAPMRSKRASAATKSACTNSASASSSSSSKVSRNLRSQTVRPDE